MKLAKLVVFKKIRLFLAFSPHHELIQLSFSFSSSPFLRLVLAATKQFILTKPLFISLKHLILRKLDGLLDIQTKMVTILSLKLYSKPGN